MHIVNAINDDVQNKRIGVGASLPSLKDLSEKFAVSRETAIAAYRELKALGVIKSSPRKGFYVSSLKNTTKHHILLFLDELNAFKEELYNGFKDGIGRSGTVDVFFHHFNSRVFEDVICENLTNLSSG